MARIRTIKPEFWSDSKTGRLSGEATKLFIGMWNFADDRGVLEFDIDEIKARIFPYSNGNGAKIIGKPLQELIEKGLLSPFLVEDKEYLWIKNFGRHQVVDRKRKSNLPEPPEQSIEISGNQLKSIEINLGKEGKGREGNGEEKKKYHDYLFFTDREYGELQAKLNSRLEHYLIRLNNYIGSKGVKYKSHYHTVLAWWNKDHPEIEEPKRRQL